MFLFSGNAVIFPVGQGLECLGVAVTALAKRLALGGDSEIHTAFGLMVDAVFFHKIQTGLRGLKPLLPDTIGMAEKTVDPAAASLHPYTFVGGVYLAFPV